MLYCYFTTAFLPILAFFYLSIHVKFCFEEYVWNKSVPIITCIWRAPVISSVCLLSLLKWTWQKCSFSCSEKLQMSSMKIEVTAFTLTVKKNFVIRNTSSINAKYTSPHISPILYKNGSGIPNAFKCPQFKSFVSPWFALHPSYSELSCYQN